MRPLGLLYAKQALCNAFIVKGQKTLTHQTSSAQPLSSGDPLRN